MAHLKKIMIVDDDADHLLAVNLIFQRKGYEVRPLLGCESLEMLREEQRRLVAEREWLNTSLREIDSGPSSGDHQRSGHA